MRPDLTKGMKRPLVMQCVFELQGAGQKWARLDDVLVRMDVDPADRKIRRRVVMCCARLIAKGWMKGKLRAGDNSRDPGLYKLTEDGAKALAMGVAGLPPTGGAGQRRGSHQQQRLWLAMRAQGRFSSASLLAVLVDANAADVERKRYLAFVQRYISGLARAGYLVGLRNTRGTPAKRWMLVRDTGPKPPVVRWNRHDVVDQNDGQVHAFDAHFTEPAGVIERRVAA